MNVALYSGSELRAEQRHAGSVIVDGDTASNIQVVRLCLDLDRLQHLELEELAKELAVAIDRSVVD